MKKLIYSLMIGCVIVGFTNCNNRTKHTKNVGTTARQYAEHIQNRNYDAFVDAIYFDEQYAGTDMTRERSNYSRILRQKMDPSVRDRGGIRNVDVVNENVSNDGRTANVTLRNNYNNGTTEEITYDMVWVDNAWRIRMDNDRQVWKSKLPDGRDVKFTLKDGDHKDVFKEHIQGDSRDFVKVKDYEDKDVLKIKEDGEKEVWKVKEKDDEIVIKHKEDGDKEVTRIPKQ